MNVEYTRDEKVAPYVVLVAKDGSRFVPIDGDCKVSYNDEIFDIITDNDAELATAKINARAESGTREKESKSMALASLSRIDAKISAAQL